VLTILNMQAIEGRYRGVFCLILRRQTSHSATCHTLYAHILVCIVSRREGTVNFAESFEARTRLSGKSFERAKRSVPGGAGSTAGCREMLEPYPLFIANAREHD